MFEQRSRKKILMGFIGLSAPFFFSQVALGQAKSKKGHLAIIINGLPASERLKDQDIKTVDACKKFGALLTKNRGLWGTGPFLTFSCEDKPTEGESKDEGSSEDKSKDKAKGKKTGSKENSNEIVWKLQITPGDQNQKFEILYRNDDNTYSPQSTYDIITPISPVLLMHRDNAAPLIAAHLALGLPYRSLIKGSKLRLGSVTLSGPKGPKIEPIKTPLTFFTLERKGDVWRADPVATATMESQSDVKTKTGTGIQNKQQWKVTPIAADIISETPGINPKKIYFMQHTEGRTEARSAIDQALRSDLGGFFDKFLNIGRSVYIGARYGKAMGGGDSLLANAPMIGIFGEFRGGLLEGIKLYYDFIPTQKKTTDDSSDQFSWSRVQLGYSIGRSFESVFLNWVDVTPKLGVSSLTLESIPTPDSSLVGYEFHLHRAPTLGLELGAEKRTNLFLARLWAYASYSLGIIEIDKSHKSSSVRTGLDLYREIVSWRTIKLAVLGFGAFDRTTIKRKLTDEELQADVNVPDELTYSSLYLGGGLTLTW